MLVLLLFLALELVGDYWNLARVGGPFIRNSKACYGCWFCTTLLAYGGEHQLK
jgi:hypothetical protein